MMYAYFIISINIICSIVIKCIIINLARIYVFSVFKIILVYL